MAASLIYLDHNSTTPIDPRVVAAMSRAWQDCGANPASQHAAGRKARRTIEECREGIAAILGARISGMNADRLIFTSGGTEANNLALFGLAGEHGSRIFISAIEHPSVAGPAEELRRRGWQVETLPVDGNGVVRDDLLADVSPGLVSIMLANNETGAIQPVADIALRCRKRGITIHTDAVQTVGKVPVDFHGLGVDALTLAPHKFHGPLGIGALLLRHDLKLQSQLFGGFQQSALRPGTENVALAIGFYTALVLWQQDAAEREQRMLANRNLLEQLLRAGLPEVVIVGEGTPRLPSTSNLSLPGINRQALVMALDLAGVACSTGSACASGSSEPSPVLLAMGLSREVVEGSIRLSLGAFTKADEVAEAARRIVNTVNHLRSRK